MFIKAYKVKPEKPFLRSNLCFTPEGKQDDIKYSIQMKNDVQISLYTKGLLLAEYVSKHVLLFFHIFILEDKLYYVGPKKDEKREVVIDAERKRQIFLDCHFNDIGHHLGQKKTVHRIQSKYYWLGIIKDVVDWVHMFFS